MAANWKGYQQPILLFLPKRRQQTEEDDEMPVPAPDMSIGCQLIN